ncbi:hypothetical protein BJX63DRAFT_414724 [Aspergillus granulosus]|uniref:Uncharacterized protein n=1 Tax=Aspergillus granulosus TaxID=176169 RepID=A0ABR4GU44_9EURO
MTIYTSYRLTVELPLRNYINPTIKSLIPLASVKLFKNTKLCATNADSTEPSEPPTSYPLFHEMSTKSNKNVTLYTRNDWEVWRAQLEAIAGSKSIWEIVTGKQMEASKPVDPETLPISRPPPQEIGGVGEAIITLLLD